MKLLDERKEEMQQMKATTKDQDERIATFKVCVFIVAYYNEDDSLS